MNEQQVESMEFPEKLWPLYMVQFCIRVMEFPEAKLNEELRDNEEWALFKASAYYPDRFEEWSKKRTEELGFDPETRIGALPE
ncbi:MAG: hypothetical protein RLZZ244_1845 [Verrucomicrobiota bacterium]|jgi:hypothetical protein